MKEMKSENFTFHPSVFKLLKFTVKGENIVQDFKAEENPQGSSRIFKAFCRIDHLCFRTTIKVYNNSPIVDFWVFTSWGHTGSSKPLYDREKLFIIIGTDNKVEIDTPPEGSTVTHGQGILKHFSFNFSTETLVDVEEIVKISTNRSPPWFMKQALPPWLENKNGEDALSWLKRLEKATTDFRSKDNKVYEPFEESRYSPSYPGRTGGQPQFGCDMLTPERYTSKLNLSIWRKQLYQEASRPSALLNPDGTNTRDTEWPDTIWAGNFDGRTRKKGWINYTDPKNAWKDRVTITPRWSGWDDQHWSLGALCQVYYETKDLGLEMILNDLVEVWFWSCPVTSKGTTHHRGGAARAQGREVEAGVNLYYALPHHKERIKQRLTDILQIQVDEYDAAIEEYGHGMEFRRDGISVWEHGLWVKGLLSVFPILEEGSLKNRISIMGMDIAKFVLKGFKWWEEDSKWAIPYLISYDQKSWGKEPSYGLSEWCLPSMQALKLIGGNTLNSEKSKKLDAIIQQYTTYNQPSNGAWTDNYKWRLL